MRIAVVVFPGTWSEHDCLFALRQVLGRQADLVWHETRDLSGYDGVILPGGFAHGDYLRPGAIARFSPVMEEVARFAREGRPVLGICNGFQVLCEAGLLPGALLRNECLEYRCQWVHLRVENPHTPFSHLCREGQVLRIPISHGDGRYYADPDTLARLERNRQVVFRYCTPDGRLEPSANPNGSLNHIAGVVNERGNVLGMMPHPERACHPLLGSTDGLMVLESLFHTRVFR